MARLVMTERISHILNALFCRTLQTRQQLKDTFPGVNYPDAYWRSTLAALIKRGLVESVYLKKSEDTPEHERRFSHKCRYYLTSEGISAVERRRLYSSR